MPPLPRAATLAVCLVGLVVSLAAPTAATPQEPGTPAGVSLERIRQGLRNAPARSIRLDVPLPIAIFRVEVKQRPYILPFMEQLNKEFALNASQRQSQDWASRCCGIDLIGLATGVTTRLDNALKAREARKTREQIARELTELDAAAKKN
jgi:hypothetical protein